MKEECLICKAPLEYLETDQLMECAICHKKENSKTRCVHGHYVCNGNVCTAKRETPYTIKIEEDATMINLEKKAQTYRLPMTSTSENLGCSWSTVIDFGNKVLLSGYYYSGPKANAF